MKMNLPNKITMFRVFMVPVFVIAMYVFEDKNYIPFIIFAVAAASDALDGHIARKYNLISNFGKFMDPLADKILVLSAFVMMVERGHLPGWVCILVLARELSITGFRTLAADVGITIAASSLGKIKTISQMLCIVSYFVFMITGKLEILYSVLVYVMAAATVISGADYIMKNKKVLRD